MTTWTDAMDSRLRRMRGDGDDWAEIGAALGVSPDIAREHGLKLGCAKRQVIRATEYSRAAMQGTRKEAFPSAASVKQT
jgi:hypothetical protein